MAQKDDRQSLRRVVVSLCGAELLTMIGVFAFPALLPVFIADWALSKTDAGWISGVYFAGYALAVPVLVAMTDRIDARRVYMLGAAVAAISACGFAFAAQGFWTAMLFRLLGGIGLAGTYMPGLRALVDRIDGPGQARLISYYTSCFSLGTSLSFLFAGLVADWLDWRWVFGSAGMAAALAILLVAALHPVTPPPANGDPLLDFRPVFRNRAALGYILGYVTHNWELFALRSWMVAFLVFAEARQGGNGWSPTAIVTLASLVSMAASIGGADLAVRFDRVRVIVAAMMLSALAAAGLGFSALLPYGVVALYCLAYNGFIQLDSAALTTGAVQTAEAGRRGATIAVHSLLGFSGAFAGPLAVGAVLDLTGGGGSVLSWGLAFLSVAAVAALGPLALLWSRRLS